MTRPSNKLPLALWLVPLGITLFWCALAGFEWVRVGIFGDAATLAAYPFGRLEGPVAGAKQYESAEAYARHSLLCASLYGAASVVFAVAGARASRALLVAGLLVALVGVGVAEHAL